MRRIARHRIVLAAARSLHVFPLQGGGDVFRRSTGTATSRAGALDWRFVGAALLRLGPAAGFAVISAWWVIMAVVHRSFGADAAIYTAATSGWLAGRDPWTMHFATAWVQNDYFMAPPPTLLFYVPFTALPSWLVPPLGIALDGVAVVAVVRRLGLPWWWCLFPPAIVASTYGQPEPILLALLVFGPRPLAPLLKPYAAAALLAERAWRSLAVAGLLFLATAPVLPWGTFVRDLGWIQHVATFQSARGDLSAWAVPWLVPVVVVALASLGWRRAGWLAAPILWPQSQPHYATLTMPVGAAWVGLALAVPVPGIGIVAAVVAAAPGIASGLAGWMHPDRRRSPAMPRLDLDAE